jgi:hypothetical protein
MVRFCRSTCDVHMCLGSGSPFARQAHRGNEVVVHPRIDGAHLDQDLANHGRMDSTSTRRGGVRGGGGFRATHQAVRARWSFFTYSQESRSRPQSRVLGIDRPQRRGITTCSLNRSRQNSTQREFSKTTESAPDTNLANYGCAGFEIRPSESVPGRMGKHSGSLKTGENGFTL